MTAFSALDSLASYAPERDAHGLDLMVSHLRHHPDAWKRLTSADLEHPDRIYALVDRTDTLLAITTLAAHCGPQIVDTIRALLVSGHHDTALIAACCRAGTTNREVADIPSGLGEPEREELLEALMTLGRLRGIRH